MWIYVDFFLFLSVFQHVANMITGSSITASKIGMNEKGLKTQIYLYLYMWVCEKWMLKPFFCTSESIHIQIVLKCIVHHACIPITHTHIQFSPYIQCVLPHVIFISFKIIFYEHTEQPSATRAKTIYVSKIHVQKKDEKFEEHRKMKCETNSTKKNTNRNRIQNRQDRGKKLKKEIYWMRLKWKKRVIKFSWKTINSMCEQKKKFPRAMHYG